MAGPSIGTWVKVRNKSGRMTAKVLAKKYGGGSYQQGEVITQSEYRSFQKKRAEAIADSEPRPSPGNAVQSDKKASQPKSNSRKDVDDWMTSNESPPKLLKLKTTNKPEKLTSVNYRGYQIYYPPTSKGRENAAFAINALATGNFPEKLTKSTKRIVFTDQPNKKDEYWAKKYNRPNFKSQATGGDGIVHVYNGGRIPKSTMAHEMGHNVAQSLWGSFHPPESSRYGQAQKKEPPVSKYGASAPGEDFAEAVKLYAVGGETRKAFRLEFPLKYQAVQELLE